MTPVQRGAARVRGYRGGEIRRTTLPGGLRVVSESMPTSRTFSIGFFVGVGSRHETDKLHGASHFLEHVLFKGTSKRVAEEISAAVECVGGDINAYTSKEHTCFYARVLDVDADMCVDVLTDMLTSSLIKSGDVEAERKVILDEIAMHADDPSETAQELVAAHVFGDSGLGRSVIGSEASISHLSRRQVVDHWRRRYQPSTMVVAAAGHVDHDRLVAQLAELDGRSSSRTAHAKVTPNVIAPKVIVAAAPADARVLSVVRPLEQCSVVMALPAPALFDDRRFPLGLLSTIIGGGMASRLFVEVRERRGLTYGIDAGESAYTDAGQWSVEWQCSPEKVAAITAVVRETMADLADHGVTDAELRRAKGQMLGQTVLAYESPSARMSRLGTAELVHDERSIPDILDRYEAVSLDEVQREAALIFSQPPVLGVVGPRVRTRPLEKLLR
jgi:predicted Zn-dependent peptidase